MGVKLAISTEAQSAAALDNMGFGIDQARRGWLEPSDIINRQPLAELKELLKR
jgi:DNA polymerase (family X)